MFKEKNLNNDYSDKVDAMWNIIDHKNEQIRTLKNQLKLLICASLILACATTLLVIFVLTSPLPNG